MTFNETLLILATVKVAYPNSFNGMTKADYETLVKLWEHQFKEFPCEVVQYAVDSIISSDTSPFYPTVAKIKDMIYKLQSPNEMSELEAWNIVKKAISRSGYHSKEEFEKLPDNLKRLVGSPRQLFDWSQTDTDELNTVIASNFQRSYRARSKSDREAVLLPHDVKAFLESKGALQIGNTGYMKLEEGKHD